jgi:hypothetical protein
MEKRVKPTGYLKTSRTSKSHIPNLIRDETRTKAGDPIPFIINARAVLLYDPNMTPKEILASIDVLKQDVVLREIPKRGSE